MVPEFKIPSNVPINQQVDFCLRVINQIRQELVPLRLAYLGAKKRITNLEKEIIKHIDDCRQLRIRIQQFEKDVNRLEKEKSDLEVEIDRITKTNKRLSTALFDHGNFKTKSSKALKRGGQIHHSDTNRETKENPNDYPKEHINLTNCPNCHHSLNFVKSIKDKVLIDIVLNPQVIKLLVQAERQWCPKCQKEINARHPQSLPFSEYGLNTLMIILLLRFKGHLSLAKISLVLKTAFGLSLAQSSIQALLSQAKDYLDDKYQEMVKRIREGELMYNDETGWLIGKQSAWLWIMANDNITVYCPANSRGNGIFKTMYSFSQALSMHDGFAGYQCALKDETKHAYCWAHFLRFVHEETVLGLPGSEEKKLKDKVIGLYQLINQLPRSQLTSILTSEFALILAQKSDNPSIIKIQTRLKKQQWGLIQALVLTPDGTNNLAERELRPLVLLRKTTYGSNTFNGMEITATLGSVVQTLSKQPIPFFPTLKSYLQAGITQKHSSFVYS